MKIHKLTGVKQTKEHIEKRLLKLRGKKRSDQFRKNVSERMKNDPNWGNWNKGLKRSKKTLKKLSEIRKGRKLSEDHKKLLSKIGKEKGYGKWMKGRSGEKCSAWKGGLTKPNEKIRGSFEYKLWREAVFQRDNWTCVWCLEKGGKLQADHIKPFAYFPELRFAIDNGRTLCVSCHRKTDTYGHRSIKLYGNIKNKEDSFIFIRQEMVEDS